MKLLNEDEVFIVNKEIEKAEDLSKVQILPVIVKNSTRSIEILNFLSLACVACSLLFYNYAFLGIGLVCFLSYRKLRFALTQQRAILEFYINKINQTEAKNGVLLFVSLKEHKVFVLCDEHIAHFVSQETWNQEVVARMSAYLKENNLCEAMIVGIRETANVIKTNVPIEKHTKNDLEDVVIQKE